MREFASSAFRLPRAPRWQKILYSVFLAFMLIGGASALIIGMTRTGLTPGDIADYYRGNPERMLFGKTFQEMLEVTHMHAFTLPMVLLVMGHLFFLTDWSARGKRIIAVLAMASFLLTLIIPWAIKYAHAAFAWVKVASNAGLFVSFAFLCGVPLYEMWFHAAGRRKR